MEKAVLLNVVHEEKGRTNQYKAREQVSLFRQELF